MHIKALTAGLALAAMTAVASAGHANALSQTTTTITSNSNNTVTVVSGDTLSNIAGRNGTTYVRLFDANTQISDPNLIFPGEVLRVPAADEQLPDRLAPAPPAADTEASETSAPAPAPLAVPAPATAPVVHADVSGVWEKLAECESSGNWAANTGNGFYGGLQFTLSSWHAVGGSGYPNQASASEQIARAQMLQARQGWSAWPACSAKLGL